MKINVTKEWCEQSAEIEGNSEIGAGCPPTTGSPLRVLRLTLKRKWFDMIAGGEKREEYREPGNWIMSRLTGKDYDVVEFSNGYGANVPRVTCRFLGWTRGGGRTEWGGSPDRHYVVIRLGEILSSENAELCGPSRERQPDTPDQP